MATIENNQTKSKRGGAGRGQGRKPGSATTKTREIADRAAAEGITPLEVMLKTMRAMMGEVDALIAKQIAEGSTEVAVPFGLMTDACAIAKDAAPYLHPRLSNVEMNARVAIHEESLDDLA